MVERFQDMANRLPAYAVIFLIASIIIICGIAWCHVPAKRKVKGKGGEHR